MTTLTEREAAKIWKTLELSEGRKAILLDYPSIKEQHHPDEVNKNLFCVDHDDQVIWRVDPPPPFQPFGDPFVHLEFDGSTFKATRFFGDICEVDLNSGQTTVVGWSK